jgi:hypothetical protein
MAIAACSNAGQPINTPNAEPACIALAGLEAQINTLKALDPSTATLQDYQTAAYNVSGMAQTVVAQARVLADAEATQLDNSLRALQDAARALPAGTTPAQAKTELSDEIAAADAAVVTLNTKISCPPLPTAPPV